jgi:chromosomal replication initiator protein
VSTELEHIWSRVQAELALSVDDAAYRIWLAPLQPLQLAEGRLTLQAPPYGRGWISDRFGRVLDSCAAQVIGAGTVVELVEPAAADEAGHRRGRRRLRHHDGGAAGARPSSHHRATPQDARPGCDTSSSHAHGTGPLGNPKLTFEQFVIGDCNRLAHAAALAVA